MNGDDARTRPRLVSSTPLLVVSDLRRALEFYERMLGFGDTNAWGEPPCFAMLHRDGFELMLSLAEDAARVQPNGPSGVWDVYLRVTDIAAELAALRAAGVTIDKGPTDQVYGMREIEVVDPDGHRIALAQDTSSEPGAGAEVWESVLDVGAAKLRLALKLSKAGGVWQALVDSIDQGALNLPVDRVTRDGGVLRFTLESIGASYEGRVSADASEIRGTWSQRGRAWRLVWRRATP